MFIGGTILISTYQPAVFKIANEYNGATGNSTFSFSGMAQGDLCIVIIDTRGGGIPATPSGWTNIGGPSTQPTSGNIFAVFYTLLTSGDISTGSVTFTGVSSFADSWSLAYFGPKSVSHASSTNSAAGATTLSIPGFTKGVTCAAIVVFACDFEAGAGFAPSGIAGIVARKGPTTMASGFPSAVYDIVQYASYADGTALPFTGFSGSGQPNFGFTLRLLA